MQKKLTILYLVTQADFGGAQKYVFQLATSLDPNQYEVIVAAGQSVTGDTSLITKLQTAGVTTYRLPHVIQAISPLTDLLGLLEIKKLCQKCKPDIIHLNSAKIGILGSLAGRWAGVPKIIYTVHGFAFQEKVAAWKKALYYWAERITASCKNTFIYLSSTEQQIGIEKKISHPSNSLIIPHGIIAPVFLSREQARKDLGLSEEKIIVGTIANLYATKALDQAILAIKIVSVTRPEIQFAILGEGPERMRLEKLIQEKGLMDNILLLGKRESAAQYLKAFDAYLCSSVKEGLPFSIIEAMLAGQPIVATRVGGIPEIITDQQTGLLVQPSKPVEIAEALQKLIEQPALGQRLGQQAQQQAEKEYSLNVMLTKIQQAYR